MPVAFVAWAPGALGSVVNAPPESTKPLLALGPTQQPYSPTMIALASEVRATWRAVPRARRWRAFVAPWESRRDTRTAWQVWVGGTWASIGVLPIDLLTRFMTTASGIDSRTRRWSSTLSSQVELLP